MNINILKTLKTGFIVGMIITAILIVVEILYLTSLWINIALGFFVLGAFAVYLVKRFW